MYRNDPIETMDQNSWRGPFSRPQQMMWGNFFDGNLLSNDYACSLIRYFISSHYYTKLLLAQQKTEEVHWACPTKCLEVISLKVITY